jgi:hypothetical protein
LWSWIRSILVPRDLDLKLYNDTANKITSKKRNAASNSPRFAYSSGHCLLILLGRKQKYIKSKLTAKLIEKRTSIAAVRNKLGQIDTFLTPLLTINYFKSKGNPVWLRNHHM